MFVGAFDIGGTKTIIALADGNGTIVKKKQFPTKTVDCLRHVAVCCDTFRKILQECDVGLDSVGAIGVNLPGIVDRSSGVLERAVYAGWSDVPVGQFIQTKLSMDRVVCENDVNSCALGELRFGLGMKYRDFGWMTVSTGIGGAVIIDGKLIRGVNGNAGEFGHLTVEYEKPVKCPCGEYGCLEAQGSGTAINRMICDAKERDSAFSAKFEAIDAGSDGAALAELAKRGNAVALNIFRKVGNYIGRGIASYVNILDPEAFIIGGGVAASISILMPGIREAIDQCAFYAMKDIKIVQTALGYDAALIGAVTIALSATVRKGEF